MRRLVVNADDLGFTPGVNQAIVKSHTGGIVTSATLMANGPAFREVEELAKQLPNLSIGCHIVLIDGDPVLPPARGSFLDTIRAISGQLESLCRSGLGGAA